MEITLNVRNILAGEEVEGAPMLDMKDLHMVYEKSRFLPSIHKECKWDRDTIFALALIAKVFGVKDQGQDSKLHKIPDFVEVENTFYDIVRVLADGHPLTTAIIPGKNFEKLKPGQIYKAPHEENLIDGQHSKTRHAIVLIGAGRRGHTNYYHFINSWGKLFCLEEDRYGFGMIRASDIKIEPLKFIRFKEEVCYHRSLASTA
uniref:Uncharacterized protein n=2 Tax=Avena sativa TaxID=4498 RepID=A0ACD6ACI5_AVESA